MALTLRLLGGLTTDEIARAFLVPEPTIAQRIVRAKRTLAEARVPFEVPRGAELCGAPRLGARGDLLSSTRATRRRGRRLDAPRPLRGGAPPGAILAAAVPGEAEVHGLVALMELQASRLRARVGPAGSPILLLDQDRVPLGPAADPPGARGARARGGAEQPLGPYALQAAIAACHARARTAAETDWARIAALYDALAELTRSPVVELNRAVAVVDGVRPARGSSWSTRSRACRRSRATTSCRGPRRPPR